MVEEYHDGERIFAYVGRSHCAAILPIKQEDGSVKYKIQDTWDSTTRYIGEWFVYKDSAPDVPTVAQSLNSAFECGETICHPRFGEGIIISATGSGNTRILEIEFKKAGIKKISEAWLRKVG